MGWIETPLTLQSVLDSWRWDTSTVVVTGILAVGYWVAWNRARRNGAPVQGARAGSFLVMGLGVWLLTGISAIGVYSDTLFWVRALQILLLLYVVPFGLAAGRPVTVLRAALGPAGQQRIDRALASNVARTLTSPLTSSLCVLAAPWLVFMTPWYEVLLRHDAADIVTRIVIPAVGFLYFYSRLQTDPVPHRFSQGLSLLITVGESLADGVLGIVLWMGPLVAAGYYSEIGRTWGPDLRLDQTIAAGIIWILGDVLGLPYLVALMRAWSSDERRKAAQLDAELDAAEHNSPTEVHAAAAEPDPAPEPEAKPSRPGRMVPANSEEPATTGLWWENDPQLRARFRR